MTVSLVKLTNRDRTVYGGFKWPLRVEQSIPLERQRTELCSDGVFHAYRNVEQALLNNPGQAAFNPPVAWEAESPDVVVDDGTKVGVYSLTLTKRLVLPPWYRNAEIRRRVQVQYAILCAEAVLDVFESERPGDDRPRKAIQAARDYLAGRPGAAAADAAADTAAYAAAYAAYAADADADAAAYAAAYAACVASTVAAAAADAAARASRAASTGTFDTSVLAIQAVALQTERQS